MKKVLIGLFSLLSMTAFAEGYNVYVRGGVNFFAGMPDLKKAYIDAQKKSLDDELKARKLPLDRRNKVEELNNNLMDSFDAALPMEKKYIKGYNLSLEGTKNVNENIELGLGVAYRINKAVDYKFNSKTLTDKLNSEIKEAGKDFFNKEFFTKNNLVLRSLSYNSIPVYVTAKYNLGTFNEFKPYVKADLGYSFNILNDEIALKGNTKAIKEQLENDIVLSGFIGKNITDIHSETKISNGLYIGGAVGTEYKNFIVELAGSYINAEATSSVKFNKNEYAGEMKLSIPIYNIGLNVGYKFNF